MSLQNMVAKKLLAHHVANVAQLQDFVKAARASVADASQPSIHPDSALTLGWLAIVRLAQAALYASGYKLTSAPGHHQTAVDSLQYTVGYDRTRCKLLQAVRKKRNSADYDLGVVTDADVSACIGEAQALLAAVQSYLASKYPGTTF